MLEHLDVDQIGCGQRLRGTAETRGDVTNYHWDFGDGQSQDTTTAATSHGHVSSGPKVVTLTVADETVMVAGRRAGGAMEGRT